MVAGKLYIGLVHYPVTNQRQEEIVTSITNLDIHDLARLAETYKLKKYFIIQPLKKQHELILELLKYWVEGAGARYNKDRMKAISNVELVDSIEETINKIKFHEGLPPKIIVTGAKKVKNSVSFKILRDKIANGGIYLLLFGTGWGLSKRVFDMADYILDPIPGLGEFNHLSVRSAASIIIDRIYGERWW